MPHLRLKLRTWIAALIGLAAGVLAWMLPPWPRHSFRIEALPDGFHFERITSDGRFVFVDYDVQVPLPGGGPFARHTGVNEVWDCEGDRKAPWISVPAGNSSIIRSLSHDETAFAATIYDNPEPRVVVFDLATGRVRKEYPHFKGCPFFSPAGELLQDDVFSPMGELRRDRGWEVRDADSNRVVQNAVQVDDFACVGRTCAPYVIFKKGDRARIHSLLTQETLAEITLAGDDLAMMQVFSQDGLVVRFGAYAKTGLSHNDLLVDFRDGVRRTFVDRFNWDAAAFTPDGRTCAWFEECESIPVLAMLLSRKDTVKCLRVMHWGDETELARFRNVEQARFSPKGNLLAVVRDDHSFAVYDFPFRKPWGLILGSAVAASAFCWGIGWVWARVRNGLSPREKRLTGGSDRTL